MSALVALIAAMALTGTPPAPDPHPSACHFGWCPIATVSNYWTAPIRLKGHKGLWRCYVTNRPTMRCVRVQP